MPSNFSEIQVVNNMKSPNTPTSITNALIAESKRRLIDEGLVRIKKCLHQISEEEVWLRPNENCNSVGNLILHLCGNVRQWILSGIGEFPDNRERDNEFNLTSRVSKQQLLLQLQDLMQEVETCLDKLTAEDLLIKRKVQAFEESKLSMLIHVVEHFSYHVGQISYIVKSMKNVDLAYYADVDLNITE